MLLGLAIGTRITSGAMLLPISMLLLTDASRSRARAWALTKLVVCALLTGGICFVPVVLQYGRSFFTYSDPLGPARLQTILLRGTVEVWGPVGLVALAWAFLGSILGVRATKQRSPRRTTIGLACLAVLGIYIGAYVKLPHEAGYLVPIVPFTILVACLFTCDIVRLTFSALLIIAPFVGYREGALNLEGPLVTDYENRSRASELIAQTLRTASTLPSRAIIVSGYRLPPLQAVLGGLKDPLISIDGVSRRNCR